MSLASASLTTTFGIQGAAPRFGTFLQTQEFALNLCVVVWQMMAVCHGHEPPGGAFNAVR